MLSLGPIPDAVRAVVQRLVAESNIERPRSDERLNGYMLTGGPGGESLIDADGEVWNWHYDLNGSGEIVERVPDGPTKVYVIAIAAERVPEFAAWLPTRPSTAKDCRVCNGSSRLPPPMSQIKCPECNGLGWQD